MKKINQRGFTLIELLIVIGIIAILAAAVIITITPGERLKDAREATRAAHFASIGTAAHTKVVEDDSYSSIHELLSTGCGFGTTTSYTAFDATCATAMGIGTLPEDPLAAAEYQVKATTTGVDSQLMIQTTATESDQGELTY
jgi:prepilin-type N-terminal cleavage/methylation domain-containing protein